MQKTIFVVDDNDINLTVAKESLRKHFRVMPLPSAAKMFALIEKVVPDLILLDIEMPEMDGFEALQRLKATPSLTAVPVIFLTGMADASVEVRGFQLGVVDFVTKPFSAPVLLNRIKLHLGIDEIVKEKTAKLQQLQSSTVIVLADRIENRDRRTGGHVERMGTYIRILVNAMREQGVYADEVANLDIETLVSAAHLHDVGKIAISDAVLNKPEKLTDNELEHIKTHTSEGERIIDQIIFRTGEEEAFLRYAKLLAGHHHERWDGTGYPLRLAGTAIPLPGRLVALADVYDALISERPYKKPFSHEEAVNIIWDGAGKLFDPHITEVFFKVHDQFKAVATC